MDTPRHPLAAHIPKDAMRTAAPAAPAGARVSVPVYDRDKALMAYGRCKRCIGTGYYRVVQQYRTQDITKSDGTVVPGKKVPFVNPPRRSAEVNPLSGKAKFVRHKPEWVQELCPCCEPRFVRMQATLMDPKTGDLFYAEPLAYITDETRAEWAAAVAALEGKGGTGDADD